MFISAGMLWACYVVALRKARLEPHHAAAIAAVGSLITYVLVYAINFGTRLFNAPWHDLAVHAFVHGFLVAVISFLCIGPAVSIFGASNGSAFAAITAILAIPILGEWPATSDWIAMLLISGGVYIATGAPLRSDGSDWLPNNPRVDSPHQLAAGFSPEAMADGKENAERLFV
jgi:drug/metabolite transporter (DMT)-like permease